MPKPQAEYIAAIAYLDAEIAKLRAKKQGLARSMEDDVVTEEMRRRLETMTDLEKEKLAQMLGVEGVASTGGVGSADAVPDD